jgi:hypothetical protein
LRVVSLPPTISLPGKVEQGRQHLRGQLDRDAIDPVERFVARQVVENFAGAHADGVRQLVEILRREHRRHGLALLAVPRLVHGDEAVAAVVRLDVLDADAAELDVGGKDRVIGLDMHDVLVLGHRPVRTDAAQGTVVDRRFLAQPFEIRPHRIRAEQLRTAHVDVLERHRIGFAARVVDGLVGSVHDAFSETLALGDILGSWNFQAASSASASASGTGSSLRSFALTASSHPSSGRANGSALFRR